MNSSEVIDSVAEDDHKADVGLNNFYCSVMSEYNYVCELKHGHYYYTTMWHSVAPAGNIYRYIGLQTETNRHALDIWHQVGAVANQYAHLLGGTTVPLEERMRVLVHALGRIKHQHDAETGETSKGFPPLQEFLFYRMQEFWPFRFPKESGRRKEWLMLRGIAWMICLVQLLVPFLILADEWMETHGGTQRLKDWYRNKIHLGEFVCLGKNFKEKLHTLMGGILLELTLLIIHSYVHDQHGNAIKLLLLPTSRFWLMVDQLTNMWCVIITTCALPLRFWDETNSTSIAMDSLTLLFVFMLDDLSGFAATYLGKTEEGYSRAAAWHKAMLSQCPVKISDLINADATHVDELWRCDFDKNGRLKMATAVGESSEHFVSRRVMRVAQMSEDAALLQEDTRLCYSTSRLQEVLPRWESTFMVHAWLLLDWFMVLVQIIFPLWWMILDKAC